MCSFLASITTQVRRQGSARLGIRALFLPGPDKEVGRPSLKLAPLDLPRGPAFLPCRAFSAGRALVSEPLSNDVLGRAVWPQQTEPALPPGALLLPIPWKNKSSRRQYILQKVWLPCISVSLRNRVPLLKFGSLVPFNSKVRSNVQSPGFHAGNPRSERQRKGRN